MRLFLPLLVLPVLGACFPTMQTPTISPGPHLDEGLMALSDQTRGGVAQGWDMMAWVAPAYGTKELEVGVPVGIYYAGAGNGSLNNRSLIVLPYTKFALLNGKRDKLTSVVQFGPTFVSSLGLLYGRDLGSWMPYGGLKWIASGGPSGDDPYITRYQQPGQLLLTLSAGAESDTPAHPAVELGILMNRYLESARPGQPPVHHTYFDLFLSARLTLGAK